MSGGASRAPRRPAAGKPRKPRRRRPRLSFLDILLIAGAFVLALMIAGFLWLLFSGGL